MRLNSRHTHGFTIVEIVVALMIVLVIAGVAYLYFANNDNAQTATDSSTSSQTQEISSNEDLDEAATTLDDAEIDQQLDASLEELDSESANF